MSKRYTAFEAAMLDLGILFHEHSLTGGKDDELDKLLAEALHVSDKVFVLSALAHMLPVVPGPSINGKSNPIAPDLSCKECANQDEGQAPVGSKGVTFCLVKGTHVPLSGDGLSCSGFERAGIDVEESGTPDPPPEEFINRLINNQSKFADVWNEACDGWEEPSPGWERFSSDKPQTLQEKTRTIAETIAGLYAENADLRTQKAALKSANEELNGLVAHCPGCDVNKKTIIDLKKYIEIGERLLGEAQRELLAEKSWRVGTEAKLVSRRDTIMEQGKRIRNLQAHIQGEAKENEILKESLRAAESALITNEDLISELSILCYNRIWAMSHSAGDTVKLKCNIADLESQVATQADTIMEQEKQIKNLQAHAQNEALLATRRLSRR